MPPPKLKEVFEVEKKFKSFFTGGNVEWTNDGKCMLCQCGGSIQFLDVETGLVSDFIGDEELPTEDNDVDLILTFTLSPQNDLIVSSHKSGLFKLWNFEGRTLKKHWKGVHKGPVAKLAINSDGSRLVSGGCDSSVRIWDLMHNSCVQNLPDMKGVCSVLKIAEEDGEDSMILAAGDDGAIKVWDLLTGSLLFSLEGHYSTVTDISLSFKKKKIVSCGRDKVLILWDLKNGAQLNVIPTYESLEALVILPKSISLPITEARHHGSLVIATGGERGVIRIWDVVHARELYVQNNSLVKVSPEGGLAICRVLLCPVVSGLAVVSYDHNIFIHAVDTFICSHKLIGYSDEILDIAYVGEEESHLAVATNSPDIKLYALDNMNCSLLTGHSGFVVTLAVSNANKNVFASASKDNSVRVWMLVGKIGVCIAEGMYHNNSVAGLALSQASLSFLLSGGEDNILKMWKIPKEIGPEPIGTCFALKGTCVAHEKDINSIAVSPNDKFIATASLDKTAKLWSADDLSPLGTMRGHRRGIWSVVFSPVDQVILTASADTTLKIWSLSDLSCLKTLEGHESSVMRALFLSRGLQVISASGDGLIKLWVIKTSECVGSFDGHTGKIWALAVNHKEDHIGSGCSGSTLVLWKDVTDERRLQEAVRKRQKALDEQTLSNLIESNKYLEALKLALTLNRPATVLKIVREVMRGGGDDLRDTVMDLDQKEQEMLLNCAAHWNTNSKTAYPAQFLLSILLKEIARGHLKPPKSMIEVLLPYTERHFARLTQLMQDLQLLEYTTLLMSQK